MNAEQRKFHESQAKKCFNETWDYIDKVNRTKEDKLNMIHLSHASRYHWGLIGEAIHFERGEWLISKVYYTLGMKEQALYHAQACLEICEENQIEDFDIAFAYEAMANAYKLFNDQDKVSLFREKAFECLPNISEEEDRAYTELELKKYSLLAETILNANIYYK